jgi:hypothetical protein
MGTKLANRDSLRVPWGEPHARITQILVEYIKMLQSRPCTFYSAENRQHKWFRLRVLQSLLAFHGELDPKFGFRLQIFGSEEEGRPARGFIDDDRRLRVASRKKVGQSLVNPSPPTLAHKSAGRTASGFYGKIV